MKGGIKRVTVAQRIERQPHLKKHLDPKGMLKSKSVLAKYYRLRKQNRLPDHEESPSESVFKDISIKRENGTHITWFQQEIPKTLTFEDYSEIYKGEILRKCKKYPVSKVKCIMNIKMRRVSISHVYPAEVIPFESEIFIVLKGTDMDEFFDKLRKQIRESVQTFLKNGSGWTIVNLERFDIYVYEYKPFAGSTYIKFQDIKIVFKGKEITLDERLAGKKAIVNMQNNDNMCFKWALTQALHPSFKNKGRITKELRKQAEKYDWSGIPFSTPYNDRSIVNFEKRYGLIITIFGYVCEYNKKIEGTDILIIPLRKSSMEKGRNVDLFFVTLERVTLELKKDLSKNKHEFEKIYHYCVITSLYRLVSREKFGKSKAKGYTCRSCCNCCKSQEDLDNHVPYNSV